MMNTKQMYEWLCATPTDIFEHLPILKATAQKCNHVTEMGFRTGVSAYAFLVARPKKYISYDLQTTEYVGQVQNHAKEENIDFEFIQKNVLEVEIEPTDLLFIDTFHTATQCKQELELHASKVKKYLIFHDIFTFGENGEDGVAGNGLLHAINPFMEAHPEWQESYRTERNNGLLILERQ